MTIVLLTQSSRGPAYFKDARMGVVKQAQKADASELRRLRQGIHFIFLTVGIIRKSLVSGRRT